MLRWLIDVLGDTPEPLLVAVALALAFAETAILLDLVVPGEAGLVVVGAEAADARLSVWLIAAAATVGAAAGDTASFAVGRSTAAHLRPRRHRRLASATARAERHFDRFGPATVFLGRWVGALRAVVPFVAGASGMRVRTFLLWNALASVAWATTVVLVGYRFGGAVASAVDRADRWLAGAVVVAAVAVLVVRRSRRRETPVSAS